MTEWYDIDQHPGRDHCESCLVDDEYGWGRPFNYLCCCRSEIEDDSIEDIVAFGQEAKDAS